MLFQYGGILLLEFGLQGIDSVGFGITFEDSKLIFDLVIFKCKCLILGLKVIHFFSLVI